LTDCPYSRHSVLKKECVGMAVVQAYVGTPRAARYVEQLTSHFGHQPGGMKVLAASAV